jgi:hypothetical protein
VARLLTFISGRAARSLPEIQLDVGKPLIAAATITLPNGL